MPAPWGGKLLSSLPRGDRENIVREKKKEKNERTNSKKKKTNETFLAQASGGGGRRVQGPQLLEGRKKRKKAGVPRKKGRKKLEHLDAKKEGWASLDTLH